MLYPRACVPALRHFGMAVGIYRTARVGTFMAAVYDPATPFSRCKNEIRNHRIQIRWKHTLTHTTRGRGYGNGGIISISITVIFLSSSAKRCEFWRSAFTV